MTIVPKGGKSNKLKNTWVEEEVSGNEYSKSQSTRIIIITVIQSEKLFTAWIGNQFGYLTNILCDSAKTQSW